LAGVCGLIGAFLLWHAYWAGAAVCLTIAAALFLLHHGVEIDLDRRKVRTFVMVLGVR